MLELRTAELKSQIARGINPLAKKAKLLSELSEEIPKEPIFKELFDKYISNYGKHHIKKWQDCIAIWISKENICIL